MIKAKLWGFFLIAFGTVLSIILVLAMPSPFVTKVDYGISFSPQKAEGLGLDWKETYSAALNDLGVRHLRLAAYWNLIEPSEGRFDFTELDYQMDKASEADAKVVLGVGRKLPRWPECHTPIWAKELPENEQQDKVIELIQIVAERYREHPALEMWQLENEPLLNFGECPPEDRAFLAREESTLRSIDSGHPILITDSGELNSWLPAASFGDTLGTTMYRTVFSGRTKKPFSYDYIFPSWMYRLKGRLVRLIKGKPVLVSELQGEPWASRPFHEVSEEERRESLSPERLVQLRDFARRTQFSRVYWWGVEYWYWEKTANNEPVFWNTARDFFK